VKEALFSILGSLMGTFSGCRVLDLFAGTGNLGIEALSRGAAEAVFVDNHRESVALVTRNLQTLGFAERSRVIENEVLAALRFLERTGGAFQLVFLDPPYRQGMASQVLERLAYSSLLDESSVVVVEYAAGEVIPAGFGALRGFDRRTYGDTSLAFFRLTEKD
jgi:16S rRNA (guanine(966)-N(2))-methyltransferase RsmD